MDRLRGSWGQSGDQRLDDARSLVWDVDPPDLPIVGYPRVRLALSADAPAASVSVKLCDVGPDGTSALIARGSLDLAFRDGVHGSPSALEPGREYDVSVTLDACAYDVAPDHGLRLSLAGSDWPNTVAPPGPVTITMHSGVLSLPLLLGDHPSVEFAPGAERASESAEGVTWEIRDDVLGRTTTALTGSDSDYPVPHAGTARESYRGRVSVDRRTFTQSAQSDACFVLTWPEAEVRVRSEMEVDVSAAAYDVRIRTQAHQDGELVSDRSWEQTLPR